MGASATQHVVQNLVRDTMRDEDVSGFTVLGCGVLMVCLLRSRERHCCGLDKRLIRTDSGRKVCFCLVCEIDKG